VNSQLSKEINFQILLRNLEHVLFCEILRQKFRLWSAVIGWSIGSVNKHRYEASTMLFTSGFRKFISSVKKSSLLKEKFRNFSFKMEFRNLISSVEGA